MNVYYTDTAKQQLKELERHFQERIRIRSPFTLPNIRQNKGTLPRKRREREFAALKDEEVTRIEAVVRDTFDGFEDTKSADDTRPVQ
jgi:hypothetical protein